MYSYKDHLIDFVVNNLSLHAKTCLASSLQEATKQHHVNYMDTSTLAISMNSTHMSF